MEAQMKVYQPQLLRNSSTANSPDNALVYRATIAPLDHPAAALTDVSDTPLLRACTAQPRLQAWADGIPNFRSRSLMALPDIFSKDPVSHLPVLDPVCRSTCYEANTLFSVHHLLAYSTGVR